ncbi:MAG: prepilin-type N-terminal cleavage/methylation domain-containing protein [Betaproteobacteria bacterium]|nr:prepilin-type N-terminal cleavage/methylation domain-containing protein [Betaproteobacteria bacterium]
MITDRGFTLAELVMVLVLIGILAFFALPRLDFQSAFSERGFHDKLKAGLQFARKTAVAQRRYVCVGVAANEVTFTVDANVPESTAAPFGGTCPFAGPLALPSPDSGCGGAGNKICAPAGLTLTATAASFQFDARGASSSAVTFSSTGQPDVKVESETGYVH